MSNQSDYDRRVRDILDRVARGHLSSEEAATLIAALSPAAPVADAPGGPSAPAPGTGGADAPSASAWADAVDSPASTGQDDRTWPATSPGTSPGAAGSAGGVEGEPADWSFAGTGDVPDGGPAGKLDEQPISSAKGDGTAATDPATDPAAVGAEEEVEHSNVPVPVGVRRVTVRAIGRRVRLVGEPAITGVAVDGPHVIKRDGDTLAINSEGDMGVSIDGFSMLRTRSVGDLKSHVNGFAKELSIRVNPSLEVEVEVTGGSVVAERLPALSRVRVTAGTAKVSDTDGPVDVLVQAGSAQLDAQLTKGRSRVRVESGTATVNLRRGSDVRVHTEAQLGRVSWSGAVNGQSKDVEIGRGRAALDVEVLVGTAQITSD